MATTFDSDFDIGDPVLFGKPSLPQTKRYKGHIRAVRFSTGKVTYDVKIKSLGATILNIDNIYILPRKGRTRIEFEYDNHA